MLLDKYYKHNGAQFLVLQIIMSSIPQFHKIIIYCMIEKEESIMFMKTKKFKREFKKSLVSLCRKENRQYLMILQFIAYYRFFFSQFWFPLWYFVSYSISFMLGVSIYVSILFNIWVKGFSIPQGFSNSIHV